MACCNFNGCRRCAPENYDDIEEVVEIHPQFLIKALEQKLKITVEALEKYKEAKVFTSATARIALKKIEEK